MWSRGGLFGMAWFGRRKPRLGFNNPIVESGLYLFVEEPRIGWIRSGPDWLDPVNERRYYFDGVQWAYEPWMPA